MRTSTVCLILVAYLGFSCADPDGPNANSLTGKGGSLARFAVTPTHLYSVDDESLNVYQIMENGALEKMNEIPIGMGVETIFAGDHRLYIGTNDAMIIYDITNPASPDFVSEYTHIVACDPVVVQDTLAFVTIRTSGCRNATSNSLEIINIKDPQQPMLVSNYTLDFPYGLGVDGNLLFVCEGDGGLKILDVSNPFNAVLLTKYSGINAYDVIPNNGVLVLTGTEGVTQYDYADQAAIKKLSIIPAQK
jgi:hypothetical protein